MELPGSGSGPESWAQTPAQSILYPQGKALFSRNKRENPSLISITPSLSTALVFDEDDAKLPRAANITHNLQVAAKEGDMGNVWFSPRTTSKDLTLSLPVVQKNTSQRGLKH